MNPIHPALARLAQAAKAMPREDSPACCALPGQVSLLHGHQVWCAFGVAERDLDCQAIHRVSNRSRGTIVSLHLYGVSAERLTTGINRLYS